jgi:hypothetical protein
MIQVFIPRSIQWSCHDWCLKKLGESSETWKHKLATATSHAIFLFSSDADALDFATAFMFCYDNTTLH